MTVSKELRDIVLVDVCNPNLLQFRHQPGMLETIWFQLNRSKRKGLLRLQKIVSKIEIPLDKINFILYLGKLINIHHHLKMMRCKTYAEPRIKCWS
jgi:hypothetical protein